VRKTTKGWHLCVEWKDGTTSWERLADLKERNPVEIAEYAATKSLLNTPDFIWWDPHVLQTRTRIIASVTKRYHKWTHKFGIGVRKSWDECVKLDKENDNTLWQDAVRKEMKNVRIAFKILNGEESVPPADITPSSQSDRALSALTYGLKPSCNLSQSHYGRTPIACAHTTGDSNAHLSQVSYIHLLTTQYKQGCNQCKCFHTQVYQKLNTHQLHLNAP
jgi:hypothetical protein